MSMTFIPEDLLLEPNVKRGHWQGEIISNCYWWYNDEGLAFWDTYNNGKHLVPQCNTQEAVFKYMQDKDVKLYRGLNYKHVKLVYAPARQE